MKRQGEEDLSIRTKKPRTTLSLDNEHDNNTFSDTVYNIPKRGLLKSPSREQITEEKLDYHCRSRQPFLLRTCPETKFSSQNRTNNSTSGRTESRKPYMTSFSNRLLGRSTRPLFTHIPNKVDPVFAAAAAAAVNAGFQPTTPADLANLPLVHGSSRGSPSAAVAAVAAAMNAAAVAAAFGAGGLLPNKQTRSSNKTFMPTETTLSTRNSNGRFHLNYDKRSHNSTDIESTSDSSRYSHRESNYKEIGNNFTGRFPHHLDHREPEDDPTATRTLFVGNLSPEISESELRELFERYGLIEDIDIKRREAETSANAFAFIRYVNLDMAHRAKIDMSGHMIGQFSCRIGYGKVIPTRCLWIGGLGPWITYPAFATLLEGFGPPERIIWPSGKNYANVLFRNVEMAIVAADILRGYPLGGSDRRIRVDFTDEAHMTNDPLLMRHKFNNSKPTEDKHYSKKSFIPQVKHDLSTNDIKLESTYNYPKFRQDQKPLDKLTAHFSLNQMRKRRVSNEEPTKKVARSYITERNYSRADNKSVYDSVKVPKNRLSSPSIHPVTMETARTVEELTTCLQTGWDGTFYLKSSSFPCRMHMLRGDKSLVNQFMHKGTSNSTIEAHQNTNKFIDKESLDDSISTVSCTGEGSNKDELVCLRITQRMKLDPLKLEDVNQRIQSAGNAGFCILIATPVSNEPANNLKQPQRPFRNLVAYLRSKDSAGVVLLNPISQTSKDSVSSDDSSVTGVLHAFPPCEFAFSLVKECAIALRKDHSKDDHLIILLIRSIGAL